MHHYYCGKFYCFFYYIYIFLYPHKGSRYFSASTPEQEQDIAVVLREDAAGVDGREDGVHDVFREVGGMRVPQHQELPQHFRLVPQARY